MSMPEHMDKGQGFMVLYASCYLSISVDVLATFNQTGEENMSFEHDSFES